MTNTRCTLDSDKQIHMLCFIQYAIYNPFIPSPKKNNISRTNVYFKNKEVCKNKLSSCLAVKIEDTVLKIPIRSEKVTHYVHNLVYVKA